MDEEEEKSARFKEKFLQAREERLFNEGNHPAQRQVRRDQFDRERERRKEELAEIEKRKERDIGQGLVGLKESQVFSYFFLDLIDIMHISRVGRRRSLLNVLDVEGGRAHDPNFCLTSGVAPISPGVR